MSYRRVQRESDELLYYTSSITRYGPQSIASGKVVETRNSRERNTVSMQSVFFFFSVYIINTSPRSQIGSHTNVSPYFSPSTRKMSGTPHNKKKPRTELLLCVSIITQSVHSTKASSFSSQKTQETKGMSSRRGSLRVMVNARYNKTIPVAAHETNAESSLPDEKWEKWEKRGMKGGYLVGYKCRQGVSLDRGRLRRFNHDPSYTTRRSRGSNTKQTFRPRY